MSKNDFAMSERAFDAFSTILEKNPDAGIGTEVLISMVCSRFFLGRNMWKDHTTLNTINTPWVEIHGLSRGHSRNTSDDRYRVQSIMQARETKFKPDEGNEHRQKLFLH